MKSVSWIAADYANLLLLTLLVVQHGHASKVQPIAVAALALAPAPAPACVVLLLHSRRRQEDACGRGMLLSCIMGRPRDRQIDCKLKGGAETEEAAGADWQARQIAVASSRRLLLPHCPAL